jgi:hypothetical protein
MNCAVRRAAYDARLLRDTLAGFTRDVVWVQLQL